MSANTAGTFIVVISVKERSLFLFCAFHIRLLVSVVFWNLQPVAQLNVHHFHHMIRTVFPLPEANSRVSHSQSGVDCPGGPKKLTELVIAIVICLWIGKGSIKHEIFPFERLWAAERKLVHKGKKRQSVVNQYVVTDMDEREQGRDDLIVDWTDFPPDAHSLPSVESLSGDSVSHCFCMQHPLWSCSRANEGIREQRQLAHCCLGNLSERDSRFKEVLGLNRQKNDARDEEEKSQREKKWTGAKKMRKSNKGCYH